MSFSFVVIFVVLVVFNVGVLIVVDHKNEVIVVSRDFFL